MFHVLFKLKNNWIICKWEICIYKIIKFWNGLAAEIIQSKPSMDFIFDVCAFVLYERLIILVEIVILSRYADLQRSFFFSIYAQINISIAFILR